MPEFRSCTKCGLTKPLTDFSKAARGKYGRKASCKSCDANRHREQFVPAVVNEEQKRARYTKHQTGPRTCNRCGITKPRSEFSMVRNGKYAPVLKSFCKACQATAARKWYSDNLQRALENRRRFQLDKLYGLTVAEYEERLQRQAGVCAICHRDEPIAHGRTGKKFRLSVDHCHDTGRVRGLLCQKCNRAIGLLGDSIDLLRKAIEYLEREGESLGEGHGNGVDGTFSR